MKYNRRVSSLRAHSIEVYSHTSSRSRPKLGQIRHQEFELQNADALRYRRSLKIHLNGIGPVKKTLEWKVLCVNRCDFFSIFNKNEMHRDTSYGENLKIKNCEHICKLYTILRLWNATGKSTANLLANLQRSGVQKCYWQIYSDQAYRNATRCFNFPKI